jgi:hypothetical protein
MISPASVWKTCLSAVFEGAPILSFAIVLVRSLMWETTGEVPFASRVSCWRPRMFPMWEDTPV